MVGAAVGDLPCFKDLVAVLFECLLIISLGYLSGRFNLISTQAKDLNSYLTTFALPMIIFLNIAQMEFQTINLSFLICMLTAKLLVFILVSILTITISYPRNFGYAGALSILATQSNDFALGYPLIKSLYGDAKPEMLSYLSLMAPIQLLILNPLGIAMLEYNKSRNLDNKSNQEQNISSLRCRSSASSPPPSPPTNRAIDARSSQVIPQEQSRQQLRLRKHSHLVAKTPDGSTHAVDSIHHPSMSNNGAMESWQQSTHAVPSKNLIRAAELASNKRIDQHTMTGTKGFKHRNIKTLSLIMPSSDFSRSEDSIHSLGDSVDYRLTQQTRAKHGLTTVDCQLVSPTTDHQLSLPNQQSPVPELNLGLPPLDYASNDDESSQTPAKVTPINIHSSAINLNFLKALATNPLIIASVVALLVNLIHGPELPKFVTRVSNTIAASFASPALFVVGLSMYGKFELCLRNPSDLLLSSVLVLTKVLILPNLMRTLALMILPSHTPTEELSYLIDFSFLYGLLPTAPTACIIANQYGILTNVVSISMLLSTFISTPLMISSAFIINPATVIKVKVIENILTQTMQVSSVVTLTLALLTLYAFWKSKKNRNYTSFLNIAEAARGSIEKITSKPTHVFLLLLVISQAMIGIGGLVWYFVDPGKLEPVLNPNDAAHHSIIDFEENLTKIVFNDNMTLSIGVEAVTAPPVPSQEPIAPLDPLPGSETISGLDSVPPVEPQSSLSKPLPEPAALNDHVESLMISRHTDLSLRILSTAQHVFSSCGLMMARFVVLCLLSTICAMKLGNENTGKKVANIMLKAYLLVTAVLLIWLVFDSDQLYHLPIEASLPTHTSSLWVRLLYDILTLSISIPLFSIILRSYNKDKISLEQSNKLVTSDSELASGFMKRPFLTSNASLSSDASSAVTSNTNLESTSNASQCVQVNQELNNNNPPNHSSNDSISVMIEAGNFEVIKKSLSPIEGQCDNPLANISHTVTNSSLLTEDARTHMTEIDRSRQYELEDPTNDRHNTPPSRCRNYLTLSEFNKCSLLIVFILINSTHNLTSIAQKLLHNEPFGTYRQIEVTNAAFEFGQGLLTFLIYGMKGFSS